MTNTNTASLTWKPADKGMFDPADEVTQAYYHHHLASFFSSARLTPHVTYKDITDATSHTGHANRFVGNVRW